MTLSIYFLRSCFFMANQDIRQYAKKAGVRLWEVAEFLGVSDPTMTRKLRHELNDSEKSRIMSIIDELAKKRNRLRCGNTSNGK